MTPALLDAARKVLGDRMLAYLIGRPRDMRDGAEDPNAEALQRYRLVPRVLTGAGGIDISADLCGRRHAAPIAVGAYAADRLMHGEGVLPIARVAARLDLPLFVSEECLTPLAAVTAAHPRVFLQLRAAGPLERAIGFVDAVAEAGGAGLLMTVLAPVHPRPGLYPGGVDIAGEINARGLSTIGARGAGVAPLAAFPAWSWTDVEALAAAARARGLDLLLKGVLHETDAARAVGAGATGVMVSNLGVRQSARFVPAVDRLEATSAAVGGAATILLDGGIRTGGDVVVARALGADLATLVRPVVLALVTGGEQGVEAYLRGMLDEITAISAWMGVERLSELGRDHVVRV